MKLPQSCHLTASKGSSGTTFTVACGSKADTKKAKQFFVAGLAGLGEDADDQPAKAKKSRGTKTSAKTKMEEGKTPYLIASVVVKLVESFMKKGGRRKATQADVSRAYAMATAMRQKHGVIAKGSRKLTPAGIKADKLKQDEDGPTKVKSVFSKLEKFLEQAKG